MSILQTHISLMGKIFLSQWKTTIEAFSKPTEFLF